MHKVDFMSDTGQRGMFVGNFISVGKFEDSALVAIGASETETDARLGRFHDYAANIKEYSIRVVEKSS